MVSCTSCLWFMLIDRPCKGSVSLKSSLSGGPPGKRLSKLVERRGAWQPGCEFAILPKHCSSSSTAILGGSFFVLYSLSESKESVRDMWRYLIKLDLRWVWRVAWAEEPLRKIAQTLIKRRGACVHKQFKNYIIAVSLVHNKVSSTSCHLFLLDS